MASEVDKVEPIRVVTSRHYNGNEKAEKLKGNIGNKGAEDRRKLWKGKKYLNNEISNVATAPDEMEKQQRLRVARGILKKQCGYCT